jgi:selenocysteine lyase/cysteine desulfurase
MIPCQRHLFDIPDDITYLNCAYMSPLMKAVAEKGKAGLERKMHPWRIKAEDFFAQSDQLRTLAGRLFNCQADDVAVVPSAGYGVQTAALNLPVASGQRILVLAEQFPSNFYPWRRLAQEKRAEVVTIARPPDGDWTAAVLRELDRRVAIAALPQTQWTTGGLLDLRTIGEACRRQGTALALDLTQSLGVHPFDVQTVQPDFAVAATYKWLLGPYTLAVMYVAPKWQQGRPLEEGWIQRGNASNFAELIHYTEEYARGARRFDMGEHSNFPALAEAICATEQLLAWGITEISKTIEDLNRRLIAALEPIGLAAFPERFRTPHYLCFTYDHTPGALVSALARRNIYVSLRGKSIRITPHVYNSGEDIERVIETISEAVKGKMAAV